MVSNLPFFLNRQASIVLRRMEGLSPGMEVTQETPRNEATQRATTLPCEELLQVRLRKAFAARDQLGGVSFCRAVHGEQDGLPGRLPSPLGKLQLCIRSKVSLSTALASQLL